MKTMKLMGLVVSILCAVPALAAPLSLPSGLKVDGLGGDTVVKQDYFGTYDYFSVQNSDTNTSMNFYVDCSVTKNITSILWTNQAVDTLNNADHLSVWVADETATGFNPADIAFYTTRVFNSVPSPDTYLASVVRTITLDSAQDKQYFRIEVLDNYWYYLGKNANDLANFMDIVVPEPVSMAMLGLGALCLLRRRHS